jgi:hypothetical protein
MPLSIHAHMRRHAAGYALTGRGIETGRRRASWAIGRSRYTAVADKRIRTIWEK